MLQFHKFLQHTLCRKTRYRPEYTEKLTASRRLPSPDPLHRPPNVRHISPPLDSTVVFGSNLHSRSNGSVRTEYTLQLVAATIVSISCGDECTVYSPSTSSSYSLCRATLHFTHNIPRRQPKWTVLKSQMS